MTNYLRQHIPHYADLAHGLEACKNAEKFQWTSDAQESFAKLRTALAHSQLLSTPRIDLPLFLATDASNVGISAILYQEVDNKRYYLSIESRPPEKKYHAHC